MPTKSFGVTRPLVATLMRCIKSLRGMTMPSAMRLIVAVVVPTVFAKFPIAVFSAARKSLSFMISPLTFFVSDSLPQT